MSMKNSQRDHRITTLDSVIYVSPFVFHPVVMSMSGFVLKFVLKQRGLICEYVCQTTAIIAGCLMFCVVWSFCSTISCLSSRSYGKSIPTA